MKPLLIVLAAFYCHLQAESYTNPVISGFAPDPSICKVGGDFYLVNSSFTMFPALPIYHSRDLVNWKLIGHSATRENQVPLLGGDYNSGIWAPTIRHHDGTFHVIVKNQVSGEISLFHTKNPAGPWSDKIIVGGKAWGDGIDPDLFFDKDGTSYVTKPTWKDGRARFHAWKIDLSNGEVRDPVELWRGTGRKFEEGPHLYRKGDYYYLLLAEGGTGEQHCVTIARRLAAKGLGTGPDDWEPCPSNPILFNDPAKKPEIHATGHADLVEDNAGNWWMVHLGTRNQPAPNLGRETFLAPVEWVDNWPIVNDGKPVSLTMTSANLSKGESFQQAVRDEFEGPELGLEWNFFRNPDPKSWSLTEVLGRLILHSTGESLSGTGRVAFVGRRLRSKQCRFAVDLLGVAPSAGQAAGISLFSQQNAFVELVIVANGPNSEIKLRQRSDGLLKTLAALPIPVAAPSTSLEFIIQGEKLFTRASFNHGATWETIHHERIVKMVPYPGFAGLYFGMHATGSKTSAAFAWCEYEEIVQPVTISEISSSIRQPTDDERLGFGTTSSLQGRLEVEEGMLDGPRTESAGAGVTVVGFIKEGGSITLPRVKLESNPGRLVVRAASGSQGGNIELRNGSADGQILATLDIPPTGGWAEWREFSTPLKSQITGVRNLVLLFRGKGDFLMNLDWIQLE
jgi:xylan 1,4-beta-xylosidase